MSRYGGTVDERAGETHRIAFALASGLGMTYDEARSHDRDGRPFGIAYVVADDGLCLAVDGRIGVASSGRVEIRAALPSRDDGGAYVHHETPKITVSTARSKTALIADVERRLLPKARAARAAAEAKVAAQNAYLDRIAQARTKLRASGFGGNGETAPMYCYNPAEGASGSVHVRVHDDSCDVEISSITVEQAIAIRDLLYGVRSWKV